MCTRARLRYTAVEIQKIGGGGTGCATSQRTNLVPRRGYAQGHLAAALSPDRSDDCHSKRPPVVFPATAMLRTRQAVHTQTKASAYVAPSRTSGRPASIAVRARSAQLLASRVAPNRLVRVAGRTHSSHSVPRVETTKKFFAAMDTLPMMGSAGLLLAAGISYHPAKTRLISLQVPSLSWPSTAMRRRRQRRRRPPLSNSRMLRMQLNS